MKINKRYKETSSTTTINHLKLPLSSSLGLTQSPRALLSIRIDREFPYCWKGQFEIFTDTLSVCSERVVVVLAKVIVVEGSSNCHILWRSNYFTFLNK